MRRKQVELPSARRLGLALGRELPTIASPVPNYVLVGESQISYSFDASTWTPATGVPTFRAKMAAHGTPGWVAVGTVANGEGSTTVAAFSSNGFDWEQTAIPSGQYRSVIWVDNLSIFVAPNSGGSSIATSSDGKIWTNHTVTTPNASPQSVGYNGTQIVVASSSFDAWVSTDGSSWAGNSNRLGAGVDSGIGQRYLPWTGSKFVTGDSSSTKPFFQSSSNGIAWGFSQPPASTGIAEQLAWSNPLGKLIALSQTVYAGDVNGTNWTVAATLNRSYGDGCVIWDTQNSQFLAVTIGFKSTSPDGVTWTESALAGNWYGVQAA